MHHARTGIDDGELPVIPLQNDDHLAVEVVLDGELNRCEIQPGLVLRRGILALGRDCRTLVPLGRDSLLRGCVGRDEELHGGGRHSGRRWCGRPLVDEREKDS